MFRRSLLAGVAFSLLTTLFLRVSVHADTALPVPAPAIPRYTVTDLGALEGDGFSGAYALNDNGQVVGWSGTSYDLMGLRHTRAFLWQGERMQEIALPPTAPHPAAYRINNKGQVLIKAVMLLNGFFSGSFPDYAYVWQAGELKTRALYGAVDFNNKGQVLTHYLLRDAPKPHYVVALWQGDRQILTFEAPPGHAQGFAHAMNDNGQIVGEVVNYDDQDGHVGKITDQQGFLYRDGKVSVLEVPADMTMSKAVAINNAGQVLIQGWSTALHRGTYSLLWQNGSLTDLDKTSAYPYLQADGLNNKGQIVGNYWTPDNIRAFLWQNGKVTDLNLLIPAHSGWQLLAAVAINSQGWIVGSGLHNGIERGFLLRPIAPAP